MSQKPSQEPCGLPRDYRPRPIGNFAAVLEAAGAWAARKHAEQGQVYGDGRPYSEHLEETEAVLLRFGYSDPENPVHQNLRVAARVHDLKEDTKVTREQIRVLLGPDVEVLVWAVTKTPGLSRKEGLRQSYAKIASTPGAVVVKLADRTANVEASLRSGSRHFQMYREEHPEFEAALRVPGGPEEPMWEHLAKLFASGPEREALKSPKPPSSGIPECGTDGEAGEGRSTSQAPWII